MKIKTLSTLGILAITTGCVSTAPLTSDCAGADAKKVTIRYKKNSEIKVSPPERKAEPGDAIRYVFKGPMPRNVVIEGEDADDKWLDTEGKGSPGGNSFYVCVGEGRPDGDYKYNIEIDGIGTLDPVVRVRKR